MELVLLRSEAMKRSIDECIDCARTCTETMAECLRAGKELAEEKLIRVLDDCAKACTLSADYMLRNSEFNPQMCSLCAHICDRCADSCNSFEEDFMQECVVTCRHCADACRKMVAEQNQPKS